MEEKFTELYKSVIEILIDAPDEFECSEEENEVYAAAQNLKEAIEWYRES